MSLLSHHWCGDKPKNSTKNPRKKACIESSAVIYSRQKKPFGEQMKQCVRCAVFLFLMLGLLSTSFAQERSARSFVQELFNKSFEIAQSEKLAESEKTNALSSLFETYFDVPFIREFVLGQHRRAFTEKQKREYNEAFARYIIAVFKPRLEGIAREKSSKLRIVREEYISDTETFVTGSFLRDAGEPVTVHWRVRATPQGFKIIDVMLGGISSIQTLRDEFVSVIRSDGIDSFISTLKTKTTTLN